MIESFRKRYNNEPKIKQAVDMMWAMLEQSILTTEDIACAAVLAAQIYAERHSTPVMISIDWKKPPTYR